jgi:catechol 2,3-dioxygenase-like lactoylglutathione lyase family enzyme
MELRRIFETCLYAADLGAAMRFYGEVLGLGLVSRMGDRGLTFRCGDGVLLIFDPERTRQPHDLVPSHGADGPGHVAFAVPPEEVETWREHLAAAGLEIEREVNWPEGRSIYLRDPAGNSVELAPPTLWGMG